MEINNIFFEDLSKIMSEKQIKLFKNALKEPFKRGICINNKKINKNNFEQYFGNKINNLPFDECYSFNSEEKIGGDILHMGGACYMQEPNAMIPGIFAPIKETDAVLDVCASPGGKTFHASKKTNNVLVSNEIDYSRAKVLETNVERLGLNNVVVTNFNMNELQIFYPNMFDVVLLDAPCSGEGMFRKEIQAVERWSEELVLSSAKTQKEIFNQIDGCLKNGGYLMYSTCTFSVEENENVVAHIVDNGYKIIDLGHIDGETCGVKIDGYATELCKRFYPHNSNGEGQFMCLLQKVKEISNTCSTINKKMIKNGLIDSKNAKLVMEGLSTIVNSDTCLKIRDNLVEKNDAIFFSPNKDYVVNSNKVISFGVKLGNIIKNRFQPSHNLFTAFGSDCKTIIDLSKEDAIKYLKGNTLNCDGKNGWCAVSYLGCVLGGGKIVDGMIKNHYPKGLRLLQR